MKTIFLLLGLIVALPLLAADPATNAPTASATAAAIQLESSPSQPPAMLQPSTTAPATQLKTHWWNHVKIFNPLSSKDAPVGDQDTITQYKGMSSRPWIAIAADPPYMSDEQDCRVHHPELGLHGSY